MLPFNPEDPFPCLSPGAHTYREEQVHAAAADAWLGLNTEEIENILRQADDANQQTQRWIGLPTAAMLTPYAEIRRLLDELQPAPRTTIADLGAGYGRMGFVIARHHPEVRFVGYEIVRERVEAGQNALRRFHAPLARLIHADLASSAFAPESAEYYFLYDYGTRPAITKTLQDLQVIARTRSITVVGRGRASRDGIEKHHPWLSEVHRPKHFPHYSIYRSQEKDKRAGA